MRSFRRAANCAGVSTRTRGAASSSARGKPSRRRQMVASAGAFCAVSANSGATAAGTVEEQLHRRRTPEQFRGDGGPLIRHAQRGHRPHPLAHDPQALPTGGEDPQPRAGAQQRRQERRAGEQHAARSCPARAGPAWIPGGRSATPSPTALPPPRRRVVRASSCGTRSGSDSGAELHLPDPVREVRHQAGGHLQRQPGLATAAGAGECHQALPRPGLDAGGRATGAGPSPPHRGRRVVSCAGRLEKTAPGAFSGPNAVGRPGAMSWKTRSGSRMPRSRCGPRSLRAAPSGNASSTSAVRHRREQDLPPMGSRQQPATAVERAPK